MSEINLHGKITTRPRTEPATNRLQTNALPIALPGRKICDYINKCIMLSFQDAENFCRMKAREQMTKLRCVLELSDVQVS